MSDIEPEIVKFLKKQTCLTVSCISGNSTWSASCYYVFLPNKMLLVYKSSETTRHIQEAQKNPKVSGTILSNKMVVGKIQGIQYEAIMLEKGNIYEEEAQTQYHIAFPYALAVPGQIWVLQLKSIKMTNNVLGFGKKLYWTSEKD